MSYCNYSDVGLLLSLTFDESTSKPLASKVTIISEMISSEINLTLKSAGISLPTSGDLLNMVKLMTMKGSAGVVGISYYGNTEDVVGSQGDYYNKEYKAFLIDVKKNPETYKNIDSVTSGFIIENQVTDGTITEEKLSDIMIGDDWVD